MYCGGWVEAPGSRSDRGAGGPATFIIRNRPGGLRGKPVHVLKERRIKIEFPGSAWWLEQLHVDVELLVRGLRDSYPCHTKSEEEPENYPNADGKPDGPALWNACTNKQEAEDYHGDYSCNDWLILFLFFLLLWAHGLPAVGYGAERIRTRAVCGAVVPFTLQSLLDLNHMIFLCCDDAP